MDKAYFHNYAPERGITFAVTGDTRSNVPTRGGNVRKTIVGVAAAIVSLVVAGVAFAGSSSALLMQYGGLGGQTQNKLAAGQVLGAGAVRSTGTLPFTGLDLALIAFGALVLMATGWTLRRAAQKQQ